jgi:hypothetical protein
MKTITKIVALVVLTAALAGLAVAQTGNSGYPVTSLGQAGTTNQVPVSNGTTLVMGTVPNAGLTNSSITFTCVAPLSCSASSALGGTEAFTWATVSAHQFFGNSTGSTAAPAATLIGANDTLNDYAAGGGTAQAQTVTLTPAATALTAGLEVEWLPTAANTAAAPTLAVSGLAAKTITKYGTTALVANDLTTTAVAVAIYDGTQFQLQNPQTNTASGTVSSCGTVGGLAYYAVTGTTVSCPGAGITLNSSGLFLVYDGITGAGLTFPVIEGLSNVTAQVASQTSVNILTSTPAAGSYLVRYYIDQNAVCATPGPGQVLATFNWTDATHAHSAVTIPLPFTAALTAGAGYLQGALTLYSATASAISYTTTYTACTTGTASYDLHASVEQTQ